MKKVFILLILMAFIFSNVGAKNLKKSKVKKNSKTKTVKHVNAVKQRPLRSYVVKLLADESGRIIYEENGSMEYPIASLTKMMTLLLTMEKIEKKEINYNDVVTISPKADDTAGISAGLIRGKHYILEELMKVAVAHSSNDAAYAIAEYASGGNIDEFVSEMNKRAQELGMINTRYYTPTGLPKKNTGKELDISTAEDMTKLAVEILKHPKYFEFSSPKNVSITELDTEKTEVFRNTNKMIGSYDGLDGLKTGFHNAAMFNIVATAKRDNLRFIAIVFGSDTQPMRAKEVETLLDMGFNNYESVKIWSKNKSFGRIELQNGKKKGKLYPEKDIMIAIKKSENCNIKKELNVWENIDNAEENSKVGEVTFYIGKKESIKENIVLKNIQKNESFWKWLFHFITFNLFR